MRATGDTGERPLQVGPWALLTTASLFFLSGAAALVYQVAWQRILALHSGVGIYSIAMIVGAFMAGIGIGSHAGGVLSVRLAPRGALLGFAALEVGIAAFGYGSGRLYYDGLDTYAAWLYASPARAGFVHFVSLLLPTALMGMSLPLLVRAVLGDPATAGKRIGVLYGINTLGAAAGALLAPWVLIRELGIDGAAQAAALGNLAAGLGALVLALRLPDAPVTPGVAEAAGTAERPASRPFGLWLALYALSGFCALALEILWFRLVDVAVRSWAFTFGTVLAIYLAGSAVGALAGVAALPRLRRPLRAFLLCQTVLLAYSGVVLVVLYALPPETPFFRWYVDYWRWYDGFKLGQSWEWGSLLRLYGVFPGLVYFVPTVLMGFSFPILQTAVHDEVRTSGRKVGLLQAANITGCVAGSLLVGLVLLNEVGTTGTLRLLFLAGLVFAGLGWYHYRRDRSFVVVAAVLLVLAVGFPDQHAFWLKLHGRQEEKAYIDEDATGVGAMTLHPVNRTEWHLSCNGKGQGALPFFEGHRVMGAVPTLVHPAPIDIAIIGLGTGGTAWAAACRPETRRVDVFELYGPQSRLLEAFAADSVEPALKGLLQDPRIHIRVEDGRNALARGHALYDIIEADPIFPDRAYSGNLYSIEFFQAVARKLKPGGLFCSWGPTPRIYASLHEAFPHVVGLPNRMMLLASNDPIPVDPAAWGERLRSPAVAGYLGETTVEDIGRRLGKLKVMVRAGRREVELNHDLFPRDEFLSD